MNIINIISSILAGGIPEPEVLYSLRVENCDGLYRVIATTQNGPGQKPTDLRTLDCSQVNELLSLIGGAKAA
tara:strand:+ start:369 stop:584 length:216 start_codon:yes stop_codon:yes gene_type:complete